MTVSMTTAPAAPTGRVGPSTPRAAELLDVAARRFVEDGIARTTMGDIARQAGAGKATLYRYYENKQAMVEALVARETARLTRHLRWALDAPGATPRRLEDAFVAALEFLRTHPLLAGGLARDADVLLPLLTGADGPVARAVLPLFAEVVAAGVAAGDLRAVHPDWVAETLFRLLLSFMASPALGVTLDDPVEVRAYVHGLIATGMTA